jgi:hypothetical protein
MAMERAAHRKRHSAGPVIRVLFPDPVLAAAQAASTRAARAQAVSQKAVSQKKTRPAGAPPAARRRRRWFPGLGILASWPLVAVLVAQAALTLRPLGTGRPRGTARALDMGLPLGTARPRGTGRHRRVCPGHRGVPAWHLLAGAARH